jgi:predicted dehydrogenase
LTADHGFDAILICADTPSNDPVELAAAIARDRGRVVVLGAVGLNIPRRSYYEKELSFVNSRSYGPGRYDASYEEQGHDYPIGYVRWTEGRNLAAVVSLIEVGKLQIRPLITHRFPISRAGEAYDLITGRKKAPFLGVLVTYGPSAPARSTKVVLRVGRRPASQIRLGVLGAGNFANATLLPAIRKAGGIELLGIASAGGLHAQYAARKFGFTYAASSAEEILKDPQVNTVAILTRHESHSRLALKALKAGKNVFVEKPLAVSDAEVSALGRQLHDPVKGILTVGFNRRFSPLGQFLSAFLAGREEPLHAHYRVNAGYLPLNHWTQDSAHGGRLIGEACHFVDFITFLVGSAPISVAACALPDLGKYHEDNASMSFTFGDGSVGIVDYLANGDKSLPKERLEVFSSGRVAILEDFRSLEMLQDGRSKQIKATQDKGWVNEWKAFARSIRDGSGPPIPYEQLIGVTKAMLAAVRALRTQRPVPI